MYGPISNQADVADLLGCRVVCERVERDPRQSTVLGCLAHEKLTEAVSEQDGSVDGSVGCV